MGSTSKVDKYFFHLKTNCTHYLIALFAGQLKTTEQNIKLMDENCSGDSRFKLFQCEDRSCV